LNEEADGFKLGFSEPIRIFVERIEYAAEVTGGLKVNMV
jgi:hypothetical protein